jgi:hypothetical protein
MSWNLIIFSLIGGLLPLSAIVLTNTLQLRDRKRTQEQLIQALLQGLHDEIRGLLEMFATSSVRPIDTLPEGKPYEGLFAASQDYFTVYHANVAVIMQIPDMNLRRSIIQTYTRAKAMLDTVNINRLYLA